MSVHLFLLAAVDGLSYAGLLFMISLGLTLICGVFGVINVAHGSFYAIGGYSAATVMMWLLPSTSSTVVLLLALLLMALLVGAVLGVLLEKYLMRYFQDRDPVLQLLVTFAAFMMLENIQRMIWGVTPVNVGELVGRMGAVELFGVAFMNYQLLFVPGIALLSFILLQGVLKHTIWGRKVMAVVYSREIATALGVNAVRVGALTFAVAGAFGALGGALAVPMSSFVPGIAAEMIVASFAVIATAGLGQIVGALIAAILIGVARALAIYTVPELEVVMPYLIMVLVLLIRPHGLFTVAEARRV